MTVVKYSEFIRIQPDDNERWILAVHINSPNFALRSNVFYESKRIFLPLNWIAV